MLMEEAVNFEVDSGFLSGAYCVLLASPNCAFSFLVKQYVWSPMASAPTPEKILHVYGLVQSGPVIVWSHLSEQSVTSPCLRL